MKNLFIGMLLGLSSLSMAQDLPGKGVKVYPMHSPIAEEKFQTMILMKALSKLGYDVQPIKEVAYAVAYKSIAQNKDDKNIHFLSVNWAPLHENMYKKAGGDKAFYRKGTFIDGCAQGYLIDKKTADKYKIRYFNDLKKPEIAKLFDSDGNGKADLAGCNPGWGCEKVIEHQLDAFKLRKTVEHRQGEYAAIISETIAKFDKGEPVLYYTYTPYWVSGKLVPGKDVVWLQVTESSHPISKSTRLPNGDDYGFNINNMRIVANAATGKHHKVAAKLFEVAKMNVNDISLQNMLISKGENTEKQIERHADSWIKAHQKDFDSWIEQAKKAK
ncbi:glycine betaine/L-proline ABC transporter substrate-binding protein ProX [Halobacteriovorax sp. GB3]|uniref:glycine betaine/L-proline ABC transporter substrate-binding protein ProX n=1 Tax=Halobacteriovorax sp. GB3 TaxID=2719615 RepID=UPI002361ABAE|nr:glycine betaine/L-proline ABC transporter substrate-binding protein ProX [Halobacteriovorax sp. GB3]MDD0852182.1 glycine betaine/L-proline ABC transporter substrate-binding protein ProX [Halobacteriovorax sp. GB3]